MSKTTTQQTILEYTLETKYDDLFQFEIYCWNPLTVNPNITIDFIIKHIDYPWVWSSIIINPGFTYPKYLEYREILDERIVKDQLFYIKVAEHTDCDYIIEHPEVPWDSYGISRNPKITMDVVEKIPRLMNTHILFENPSIDCKQMDTYIQNNKELLTYEKQSVWCNIAKNVNLEEWFVEKYMNYFKGSIAWSYIFRLKALTMDFIEKYNMNDVRCIDLLHNPNITEVFVLKCRKKYGTELLLKRQYILNIIKQPNISLQFIQTHLTESRAILSYYPKLPQEMIQEIHDKPELNWCWSALTINPSITMDFIKSHTYLPWYWSHIHQNPNCNVDDLIYFKDRILKYDTYSLWLEYPLSKKLVDEFPIKPNGISCNVNEDISYMTYRYWMERREITIQHTKLIREELLDVTWSPDRDRFMEWCFPYMELKTNAFLYS